MQARTRLACSLSFLLSRFSTRLRYDALYIVFTHSLLILYIAHADRCSLLGTGLI